MSEIIDIGKAAGALAEFKPEKAKEEIAKADALINLATNLQNWPLLEKAIDHKIEEQEEFVRWWKDNIGKNWGGDRQVSGTAYLNIEKAEKLTGITQPQVSKWGARLKEPEKYRTLLFDAAYRKAMAQRGATDQKGASGTGENEWYTPPEYLDLARRVLGAIDLDPASSAFAQNIVRATAFFSKDNDGLTQEWHGRVWLNPPYAQPAIAHFVSKLVTERRAGRVTAALMLTHNYTDTAWFHEAAAACDAICFTRGRVRFVDADGVLAAPTQGQAFFYFGSAVESFAAAFCNIGFLVIPVFR